MTTALLLLYNNAPPSTAVAVVFTGMVVFEMARLVDIRTDYKIKWFSNPMLSVAIALSILLQLAVLHVDGLAHLFEVNPITVQQWLFIGILSILLIVIMKLLNKPLNKIGREN